MNSVRKQQPITRREVIIAQPKLPKSTKPTKPNHFVKIVPCLVFLVYFTTDLVEAWTKYTTLYMVISFIGGCILNSLHFSFTKPKLSYVRELITLVIGDILFTLTLSEHRLWLWAFPFLIGYLVYNWACWLSGTSPVYIGKSQKTQ